MTCIVSPDDKYVISGNRGNEVRIWDLKKYCEVTTLRGHGSIINHVAISPDGKRLITAAGDRTLRVWDMADFHEICIIKVPSGSVNRCVFSPNGKYFVTGSRDGLLKLWDINTYETIGVFPMGNCNSLTFSKDGNRLIASDSSGIIYILHLENFDTSKPIITGRSFNNDVYGIQCPVCNNWSEIPRYAIGSEMYCPLCKNTLLLNSFTLSQNGSLKEKIKYNRPVVQPSKNIEVEKDVKYIEANAEERSPIQGLQIECVPHRPWWKLW
jgi:WD40 repeat protein